MTVNSNGPTPTKQNLPDGMLIEWDLREYTQLAKDYIAANLSKNHLHWDEDKKYLQIDSGFIRYRRKKSHKHSFGKDTKSDMDLVRRILSAEALYYPQAEKEVHDASTALYKGIIGSVSVGRLVDKVSFYGSLMMDERLPESFITSQLNIPLSIFMTDDGWSYLTRLHHGSLCLVAGTIGTKLFAKRFGYLAARDVTPNLETPEQINQYIAENYLPFYSKGRADMNRVLLLQQIQMNRINKQSSMHRALRDCGNDEYRRLMVAFTSESVNFNEKYRILRTEVFRILRGLCEQSGLNIYKTSVEELDRKINSPL